MDKRALRAAFPHTIPVLTGYLFLGFAFGVLLASKGYHVGWAILMSIVIYAGSMQFVAIELLCAPFDPLGAFFMTLMVNARHLFYGVAMIETFRSFGREKPYMIHTLTDETFSLMCSAKPPEGVDQRRFRFFIAMLDQLYWIAGCTLGTVVGSAIVFDSTGIDFVMTALFVVIFVEQWQQRSGRIPALIGVGGSALCLLVFGPDNFLLPAMALILTVLLGARRSLEGRDRA